MTKNTKTVVGIDVGGSTTKIVGFKSDANGENKLISPFLVRATDPITSIYGAFGKKLYAPTQAEWDDSIINIGFTQVFL